MQILDLTNLEKSDIKYNISRFPDGEVQISIGLPDFKSDLTVKCRITNAEELFILQQVIDILDRYDIVYHLEIYYLMGMRMDRVMDFSRPFTLKVIADTLNKSKAVSIGLLEMHSDRIFQFSDSNKFYELPNPLYKVFEPLCKECQIVYPDKGAEERYDTWTFMNTFKIGTPIKCRKVRNLDGDLAHFEVVNPEDLSGKPLLILDDLCDGGGTFVGILSELRKHTDVPVNIMVTHLVNPKGLFNLSDNFDKVWITNSYKEWKNSEDFPNNVTQIDVLNYEVQKES